MLWWNWICFSGASWKSWDSAESCCLSAGATAVSDIPLLPLSPPPFLCVMTGSDVVSVRSDPDSVRGCWDQIPKIKVRPLMRQRIKSLSAGIGFRDGSACIVLILSLVPKLTRESPAREAVLDPRLDVMGSEGCDVTARRAVRPSARRRGDAARALASSLGKTFD